MFVLQFYHGEYKLSKSQHLFGPKQEDLKYKFYLRLDLHGPDRRTQSVCLVVDLHKLPAEQHGPLQVE
ncbi:Uncharacterised protein [Acinetobacter baumannii]|nr:Uncharacterised protein [Acinetobacter baumannii]